MTAVLEGYSLNIGSGADMVANKPSGLAVGELMLAILATDDDPTITTAASGWNLEISGRGATFGACKLWVYSRVATASESASWTWTHDDSEQYVAIVCRFSGHDGVDIADMNDEQGNQTTHTCPSVTTTVDDCYILRVCGFDRGLDIDVGAGEPSEWEEINGSSGCASAGHHDKVQASAGSTGTLDFTYAASWPGTPTTIAIAPAAGGSNDGAAMYHHLRNLGVYG